MNHLIVFHLLIILFSCDVKKKESSSQEVLTSSISTIEEPDSDFDGITDKQESLNGTDPNVAQLPTIGIWDVSELETSINFNNIDIGTFEQITSNYGKSNKHIVLKKINHLIYNQIFNGSTDIDMFPTLKDYFSSNLGCIDDESYFRQKSSYDNYLENNEFRSFKYALDYKVKFDDLSNVSSISRLVVNSYLAFPEVNERSDNLGLRLFEEVFSFQDITNLQSLKSFKENRTYNESRSIENFINSPHCIYSEVEDFDYTLKGKKFKFSEQVSLQEENNSTLYLVIDNEVKKYSFVSNRFSIIEFLNYIGIDYELDSNNLLLSLEGKVNQLPYLLDATYINSENMLKRRWFYLNTENRDIKEKTLSGSIHIIHYPSLADLIKSSSFEELITKNLEFTPKVKLVGVSAGDELELSVELSSRIPQVGNVYYLIDGLVKDTRRRSPRGGEEEYWRDGKQACHYNETNQNSSLSSFSQLGIENFSKDLFQVKIGNRAISPAYAKGNKLYYKFVVNYEDLNNEIIELGMPSSSIKEFSYKRDITYRHVKKRQKRCKSIDNRTITLKAKREFKYRINAKRKGVIK